MEGELDGDTCSSSAPRLLLAAESGHHLVLDLARVSSCADAGLDLFLHLHLRARARGGSLHLVTPSIQVRRTIVLASLFDVLPIAADLSTVITRLGRDIVTTAPVDLR